MSMSVTVTTTVMVESCQSGSSSHSSCGWCGRDQRHGNTHLKEIVIEHLVTRGSPCRILAQAPVNQATSLWTHRHIGMELERSILNVAIRRLHIGTVEWWLTVQHGIEAATNGPNITRFVITAPLQNFWRQIVRGADNGGGAGIGLVVGARQAKVTNLEHIVLLREEHVTNLEIPVNDSIVVHVNDGAQYLSHVEPSLTLVQPPLLDQLFQRLSKFVCFHHNTSIQYFLSMQKIPQYKKAKKRSTHTLQSQSSNSMNT